MNNKPIFYCTRPRIYALLVEAGYTPINTMPNYYNPKFKVWMFERTKEVQQIVDDFYNSIERGEE